MSSQDKVERALKEIHVAFSKCQSFGNHPDKIIVDRRQFLELLDRLNMGIFDMLEEYEHTRQSRDKAERDFRKKGDQIISDANLQAEDVYAASMLYTADMIGRIRDSVDKVNDSMDELFRGFRRELREQKDMLKHHESELVSQLTDLTDTRKYLSILEDINQERRRRNRDENAVAEVPVKKGKEAVYTPPSQADVKVNGEYFEKTGKSASGTEVVPDTAAEKADVVVNENAAYFKWKESQKKQDDTAKAPEAKAEPTTEAVKDSAGFEAEPGSAEKFGAGTGSETEFPNEEAIMRAVLADEMAAGREELEKNEPEQGNSFLKRIFSRKQ